MTAHPTGEQIAEIDISDEACAVACMLVSNPQGVLRRDGDGWQRRVNYLIRALRDERNRLEAVNRELMEAEEAMRSRILKVMKKWLWAKPDVMRCVTEIKALPLHTTHQQRDVKPHDPTQTYRKD